MDRGVKLRIVSDGTTMGTRVIVGENQLSGVIGITVLPITAKDHRVSALIEFRNVELDIVADQKTGEAEA